MRRGVARVRAREAAAWLADYVGKQDPDSMRFSKDELLGAFGSGFDVGAKDAEEEWTIERATGQRQLDDARALIIEATNVFRSYETIALNDMEERGVTPADPETRRGRNRLMADRLEAWLRGEDRYPVSVMTYSNRGDAHPLGDARCRIEPFAIPAEIAANGDLVPIDSGKSVEDCRARFGNTANFGGFPGTTGITDFLHVTATATATAEVQSSGVVNVRPVSVGPLADPGVVQAIVDAAGGDEPAALTLATEAAFRLSTTDPRFDPDRPVCVNGFLYHPAKEDLCKPK